jgi:hypothetical protein
MLLSGKGGFATLVAAWPGAPASAVGVTPNRSPPDETHP